jgi:hypothetical protein
MYIAGERISAVYPMSIISPGGGINVTCFSYGGGIHFGCTVDPELVPDPWGIIDGVQQAIKAYVSLVDKKPVRKRQNAEKVGTNRVKRSTGGRKPAQKPTGAGRKKPGPRKAPAARKLRVTGARS